jgi:hypothetical protein
MPTESREPVRGALAKEAKLPGGSVGAICEKGDIDCTPDVSE